MCKPSFSIILGLFVLLTSAHGALADRSRALAPLRGQLRVDGVLDGPLDSARKTFSVMVYAVTLPTGERQWLIPARSKTVRIRVYSQFTVFGQPATTFGLYDEKRHAYHVVVMGNDDGPGTPLSARYVWVSQEGPAQVAYLHSLKTDAQRRSGHVSPEIETISGSISAGDRSIDVTEIRIKLSTVRIKIGLANNTVGQVEPLGSIASRYGAIAAINGSFFDADDQGSEHMPDMPLVSNGAVVGRSYLGTLLGFCNDGEARMEPAQVALSLHDRSPDMPVDLQDPDKDLFWERVEEGVGCGPRLVTDGRVSLDPFSEGITSDEVLNGSAIRSAVGLTDNGWLILVVTRPATLNELAEAMRNLGAYQAMNLDGGSSSGLWLHGDTLLNPGRWLSNALLVLKR